MTTPTIRFGEIQVGDKIELTTPVGGVFQGFVVNTFIGPSILEPSIQFRDGFIVWITADTEIRLLCRPAPERHEGDVIPGNEVFNLPIGSQICRDNNDVDNPANIWVVVRRADTSTRIYKQVVNIYYANRTQNSLTGFYRIIYLAPEKWATQ